MKRSDFWNVIWIPLKKRIPPNEMGTYVLVWNYKWNKPIVMESYIAHASGAAILENRKVSEDRLFSDWCKIAAPKKKKKSRRTK